MNVRRTLITGECVAHLNRLTLRLIVPLKFPTGFDTYPTLYTVPIQPRFIHFVMHRVLLRLVIDILIRILYISISLRISPWEGPVETLLMYPDSDRLVTAVSAS